MKGGELNMAKETKLEGRCMRCKDNRAMSEGFKIEKTPKGSFMAKGKCSKCGCGMCKLMSAETASKYK